MTISKTDISKLDKKKLGYLLQELGGASSYQMADKRGEWGIEDALIEDLGYPDPNLVAKTDEEEEELEEALYETAYAVIDEFDRVVEAGLKALGYELKPKVEE